MFTVAESQRQYAVIHPDILLSVLKLTSHFINLSQKTLKWLPYILICQCTSLLPWFIILLVLGNVHKMPCD